MGCGLRKIRQTEDSSPGKIYSTLKRPQVETKIGVAYTYCHLDFLVGKEDGTSTLCLSSVRELPSQLRDLYQQGFVLTAVHPFVHPCGPEPASVQRQLYRAVLTKLPECSEKNPPDFEPYHLKLEECLSADCIPTPEHIQGYVKKQIQDAADQGIAFAGFIQDPAGLRPRARERTDGAELSLSLHSSPSSLHGSELTASPSHQEDMDRVESGTDDWSGEGETMDLKAVRDDSVVEETSREYATSQNNNKAKDRDVDGEAVEKAGKPSLAKSGADLFGLFNYPGGRQGPLKYYTVKVPLKVQQQDGEARTVEANWLDHMTQHFNNGASLVDGYFHLGSDNDQLPKVTDSVFIFQEGDANATAASAYDAIVVEQWTVIDGVQVKTDYLPLLQSLASYGWRLTCVLPTPIIKTNSDGSVSTKQMVFLQRPMLPLKRRHSKKLIFRTRSKSGKNSVKDAPKNKKKCKDKEPDEQKLRDGRTKSSEAEDKRDKVETGRDGESDGEITEEEKEKKRVEEKEKAEATERATEVNGEKEADLNAVVVNDGECRNEEVEGELERKNLSAEGRQETSGQE